MKSSVHHEISYYIVIAIGVVWSASAPTSAGTNAEYEIFELPSLGFFALSRPRDIDAAGRVYGDSLDSTLAPHAIQWNDDVTPIVLDASTPGATSRAWGASQSGIAAGWWDGGASLQASMWEDGVHTLLNPLSGHIAGWANDVNDDRLAVGWSFTSAGFMVATKWVDESPVQLAALESIASAVNGAGQIVGRRDVGPVREALLWEDEELIVLDDLGDDRAGAVAISENGNIVGSSLSAASGKFHAVLWTADDHTLVDLGLFDGFAPTDALGVNDSGVVVGTYNVDLFGDIKSAVIWRDGVAQELVTLLPPGHGWTLENASAINNDGVVTGIGMRAGFGGLRAYVMVPINAPDPTGDLNDDGTVGPADLALLLGAWGDCDDPRQCPEDINDDGLVGPADLALLLGAWG